MFKKLLIVALLASVLCASQAQAAYTVTAVISNGGSLSAAAALTAYSKPGNGFHAVGIIMPAAWTSASITLQGSVDNCVTFQNVFIQAGTEYTITSPAAAEYMALNPSDLIGLNCLKVRSGTSASPVAQGAARNVLIVLQ